MFDPQHFDNSNFGDPKSWLSGDGNSSPTLRRTDSQLSGHTAVSSVAGSGAYVHQDLLKDLEEMVPLVESLIHRKAKSSFTRRGSVAYTKTPSRESLYKKMNEPKGRTTSQSIPAKKKREHGDKDQATNAADNQDADSFSVFSSRTLIPERQIEELAALQEQVDDMKRKLLEKDELLKSAESSRNERDKAERELNELKHLAAEKESLIKSMQLQLNDVKIKLADKQAALEKAQWEAMTSNEKVEKLQENVETLQGDISSLMHFFDGLADSNSTTYAEDCDVTPSYLDSRCDIDNLDVEDMLMMEEARQAYVAAVAYAKEKQDEDSIVAAANARRRLHSIIFKSGCAD